MERGVRGRGARAGAVAGTGCHRSYQVRRIRRRAVFGVEKYLCCLGKKEEEEKERRGGEGAEAGAAGVGA